MTLHSKTTLYIRQERKARSKLGIWFKFLEYKLELGIELGLQ